MQKFFRGHRVRILHPEWYCIRSNEGIVAYSYSDVYEQRYESTRPSYSLYVIEDDNNVSWFDEEYLELIDSDRDKGEMILQSIKKPARVSNETKTQEEI